MSWLEVVMVGNHWFAVLTLNRRVFSPLCQHGFKPDCCTIYRGSVVTAFHPRVTPHKARSVSTSIKH